MLDGISGHSVGIQLCKGSDRDECYVDFSYSYLNWVLTSADGLATAELAGERVAPTLLIPGRVAATPPDS